MQTILGAGGAVGVPLAIELKKYTDKIRLVSRNPKQVNADDELYPADLTNDQEVMQAVKGSEVAYLTAGLKYDLYIWQRDWPCIMTNVINACKEHSCKLIFFDNVYAYGKVDGWMMENTPYNPISKKGEVRARIAEQFTNEYRSGDIKGAIVRGADFYGPAIKTGVFNMLVIDKLKVGRKANWIGNAKVRHSLTYTPDAGKAVAIIGNTDEAYNQVWHAPTDPNALTGEQFIKKAAELFNVKPDYSVLKKWQLQLAGIFNTEVRETVEMLYQYEYEYLFDSSKFNTKFKFAPASYDEGIKMTVKASV